jgi:predicted ester cyclase
VVDEPWIAAHLADRGTHREIFCGVEATGRSVSIDEFAFYRVDAGCIAECGHGLPRSTSREAPVARPSVTQRA